MEAILLIEISQAQEDRYCLTLLHEAPRVVESPETESAMVVAGSGRRGQREIVVSWA